MTKGTNDWKNLQTKLSVYEKFNNISATFPNLNIFLRIYLALPIRNARDERSFSVMARIIFLDPH